MEIEILYEDDKILVINKPVGLVVNRAESIKGETVQDWVERRSSNVGHGSWSEDKLFKDRSGVCHRLDKETSGCLLIAKNPTSLRFYLKKFESRKIVKKYVALVHGEVSPNEGSIVLPMRRGILDREKWQVHYDGKKAVTYWRVEKIYDFAESGQQWNGKLSLLELDLKTGRTHQIRVHLSFLGWPIFSDERYLNKKQLEIDEKYLGHHFLHSRFMEFEDEEGIVKKIEAPLPPDCLQFLSTMIE